MRSFWSLYICGLIGSLLLWALPNSLKGFHFSHRSDEWKILFVEQTRQIGFAPNGLVYAHIVMSYDSSELGKTGRELNPIREQWYKTGSKSKTPWPLNSNRITYDEWGPSNWRLPNGIKVQQNGQVFCVPYSIIAITCALPLLLRGVYEWRQKKRRPASEPTASELARP